MRRFASRRLRSVTPQRAPALVLLAVTTPEGGYVFLRQPVARLARDVLHLPFRLAGVAQHGRAADL